MAGLDDAYSLETPDDNRRLYRDWAATYESNFITSHAYIYHESLVATFAAAGPRPDGPLLDVGCGTGLVGMQLAHDIGGTIDGLDISPEMLAEAAKKRLPDGTRSYRCLIEADMTAPVDIADGTYAGIVSAGTFTHGHVGPEAIRELVRVAMPGGVCALGINERFFAEANFDAVLADLADRDKIEPHEIVTARIYDADKYAGVDGEATTMSNVAVFRVI